MLDLLREVTESVGVIGKFEIRRLSYDTECKNTYYTDGDPCSVFVVDQKGVHHTIYNKTGLLIDIGYIESHYNRKSIADRLCELRSLIDVPKPKRVCIPAKNDIDDDPMKEWGIFILDK